MKGTTLLLLATVVLAGCATTTTSNDAEAFIRAADTRFAQAFNRGDWGAVTAIYANDAVSLMPNADAMRGSAAIRQNFNKMQGTNANLTITPDRVVQSGDIAYETGTYSTAMTGMNDRGKYLTVWRRQPNGDWRIVADMINTSLPASH